MFRLFMLCIPSGLMIFVLTIWRKSVVLIHKHVQHVFSKYSMKSVSLEVIKVP